jgi:protein-disulfide isomerase
MNNSEIVRLQNAVNERDHISGSPNAPVTLVEYGNFDCIQCGHAYPVLKKVRQLMGDNLRFVFRHFTTYPRAVRVAEAAEAAGAQGKFWEMHDELFKHQDALEDHNLSHYAKRIGLDAQRFEREMEENVYVKQIEAGYELSLFAEHVTGTPTFYINDVRYTGATDVESLLGAIKQAAPEGRIRIAEGGHGLGALLGLHRRRGE